jgi:hypothetical protein
VRAVELDARLQHTDDRHRSRAANVLATQSNALSFSVARCQQLLDERNGNSMPLAATSRNEELRMAVTAHMHALKDYIQLYTHYKDPLLYWQYCFHVSGADT